MKYTEQQIEQWKKKAEKWDYLASEIQGFYEDTADEEDEREIIWALENIAEAAARAFGYL